MSLGFIGSGVSLLCLNFAKSPEIAPVLLTAALSLSSFSQAGFLLNMQDIAPQYAGFLHGISNSAGTLAAIISTIGTGYFVQWLGSFQAFLSLTAFCIAGIQFPCGLNSLRSNTSVFVQQWFLV
ncbi:hypothetical protein F3Y22_tig00109992pilonHSYRG00038 [Hibiscus syriacus]|uniref:Major facilitator superfamily (MFS) profile domain-containing protein n=1 Tax=Hibiscus syriacus TaxID=106335 RepID=A0A6A3BNY2_HIBSY|nr:hypothetical protein F3Y22_tig00109992pilonHSYRG00038 [Hibiscus syriacus]